MLIFLVLPSVSFRAAMSTDLSLHEPFYIFFSLNNLFVNNSLTRQKNFTA